MLQNCLSLGYCLPLEERRVVEKRTLHRIENPAVFKQVKIQIEQLILERNTIVSGKW